MKKITVAIDGYSSCGKSTMAKQLAHTLGYIYVDTGAMYRAVTLYALQHNLFCPDGTICERELNARMSEVKIGFQYNSSTARADTYLCGVNVERDIRGMDVSAHVSTISALGFVREALTAQQREMGRGKGVVMDGRDIGTTVFPDAELKVFVSASPEIRAWRRYDELTARGVSADFNEILENVKQRDYTDTHRQISPLRQAPDALFLDNSNMTREEQNAWLEEQAKRIINS
ncbi:MAG: (d)CMP kinase [Prevotella sp.]|nr:(d)CMP kinase [Prevotella sp.]